MFLQHLVYIASTELKMSYHNISSPINYRRWRVAFGSRSLTTESGGKGDVLALNSCTSHPGELWGIPDPAAGSTAAVTHAGPRGVLRQSLDPQLWRKDLGCSGRLPQHFVFRDLALITFYLFFLSFFFPLSYTSVKSQFPREVLHQTE